MIYEQQIELTRLSDGESGQSSFIHIKYSDDKKTFTGNSGEDVGIYLGIYTDNIEEDSMDFNKYTWSKIVGKDGAAGTGVDSITKEFYLSTSKITQEGGSWVTSMPTWEKGKYIWTREKVVYTNPASTAYTEPICDTAWEAIDNIKLGTVNLIHNAQTMIYVDYQLTSFAGSSVFSVDNAKLNISSVTATINDTTLKLTSDDITIDETKAKLGGK